MDLDRLLASEPGWLDGEGPRAGLVVSTRARLARNISGAGFVNDTPPEKLAELKREIRERLAECPGFAGAAAVDMDHCRPHERRHLVESMLAPADLARLHRGRSLVVAPSSALAAAVNDQDHLRLAAYRPGFDPAGAVSDVLAAEREAEQVMSFAFSEEFGYLTAGLGDVGTGLRLSALVHLPALTLSGDVAKIVNSLRELKFSTGGVFGKDTEARGALYRIANTVTLGRGERDIAADFEKHVGKVLHYERVAREALRERDEGSLADMCGRAWGVLRHAARIGFGESLERIGLVRLGSSLGLLPAVEPGILNRLLPAVQPSHLRRRFGSEAWEDDRRRLRSAVIRESIPFS